MILFIDTTSEITHLSLLDEKGQVVDKYDWPARFNQSEELIQKIDLLLKDNKITKADLRGVIVNRGPGSYTGLRVGLTTANLLSYALSIPVLGIMKNDNIKKQAKKVLSLKHFSRPVEAFYSNPPHITTPKI